MKRRDFIKTASLTAAALAANRCLETPALCQSTMSKERILGEADARIEKHRKADAVLRLLDPGGKPLDAGAGVEIRQTSHKFLFGCNIFKLDRCRTADDNAAYAERFSDLLNFATLPFYWWNYERRRGVRDDDRTDRIVQWCRQNNVTTKGHPLAWNYVDPPWLPKDPDEAMRLQYERIDRCVRRFAGAIDIWDVVNEATHYDRPEILKRAPVLTEAIRKMGIAAYVRGAFAAARKAGPNATLVINDYRTDPAFDKKVISELSDESGRPMYDVVGIQSHMHGAYWGPERTWQVCDYFARFAKPLHFTETTVVSGPRTDKGWLTTPEGEQSQARDVIEFYSVLFSHPSVEAVTWWDFTDQNAWQAAPAGLVRADMTPKPAYEGLQELVKGKWWTRCEATVADAGKAGFCGFLGAYEVAVMRGARKLTGTFRLDKGLKDAIEVRLS